MRISLTDLQFIYMDVVVNRLISVYHDGAILCNTDVTRSIFNSKLAQLSGIPTLLLWSCRHWRKGTHITMDIKLVSIILSFVVFPPCFQL